MEGNGHGGIIERPEVGQTVKMVPMKVGKENVEKALGIRGIRYTVAELAQAAATVEDKPIPLGDTHLNACGVAAIAEVRGNGRRD